MRYKAIFFDWDGTAVESRKAPAADAAVHMKVLLGKGIKLIIISGTTYDNIAGGRLHEYFTEKELDNLYLGLGRGALNYSFTNGQPVLHQEFLPGKEERLAVHKIAFEIHQALLKEYDLDTDVVFSRPNYCKLDLMAAHDRGEKLFLQSGEIDMVQKMLREHGLINGLNDVVRLAEQTGKRLGLAVKPTTDAKYLEVGTTTKSDNADYFVEHLLKPGGIAPTEACYWGDEFTYLAEGIRGSDAYMITEKTREGDFYDVSENPWRLPKEVKAMGGGTKRFLNFLKEQGEKVEV